MKFLELDAVVGMELNFQHENLIHCRICMLSKEKNELQLLKTSQFSDNINNLLLKIPKKLPIALCITGKGLIQKRVKPLPNENLTSIFQKAFPSVLATEFYMQSYNSETFHWLSVIRRDLLDGIIDKLSRGGCNILQVSLGPMVSTLSFSQLANIESQIQFDGHQFVCDQNKEIISYEYNENFNHDKTFVIDQEKIAGSLLIAYASGLQLIALGPNQPLSLAIDYITANYNNFLWSKRLKIYSYIGLALIFILLVISYSLQMHFEDKNQHLQREIGQQSAGLAQLKEIREKIEKNESLLKELDWNGGFNYGYIMEEIGQSVPMQVQLITVNMKNGLHSTSHSLSGTTIQIKGLTSNLLSINNWLFALKNKKWVKSVRLAKYNRAEESNNYEFSIDIIY